MVNDYAGHPFQIELSLELAKRGYRVDHAYCSTNVTPRGDVDRDFPGLEVVAVSTGDRFDKYNVRRRLVGEVRYGVASSWLLMRRRPAASLNANVPIVSLLIMTVVAKLLRIRNVLWLQDIQAGLAAIALGSDSHPVVRILTGIERWCIRNADHVVAISKGFEEEVVSIGVKADLVTTIPNWAPIADVPVRSKDNEWARSHDLVDSPVLLYSGSMGIKHRPQALISAAKKLAELGSLAKIVVVSEGVGADWLRNEAERLGLDSFVFLPFQQFHDLPDVLGTADALVVLLEPDAGEFSVPSKVLTYLCAGRAIVGLMPLNNAASRLVADNNAGFVSDNELDFADDVVSLLRDEEVREGMGLLGRLLAETEFDPDRITKQFEEVLHPPVGQTKEM